MRPPTPAAGPPIAFVIIPDILKGIDMTLIERNTDFQLHCY